MIESGYEIVDRLGNPFMTVGRDGQAAPQTFRATREESWRAAEHDESVWMIRNFTRAELERQGCRVVRAIREVDR